MNFLSTFPRISLLNPGWNSWIMLLEFSGHIPLHFFSESLFLIFRNTHGSPQANSCRYPESILMVCCPVWAWGILPIQGWGWGSFADPGIVSKTSKRRQGRSTLLKPCKVRWFRHWFPTCSNFPDSSQQKKEKGKRTMIFLSHVECRGFGSFPKFRTCSGLWEIF